MKIEDAGWKKTAKIYNLAEIERLMSYFDRANTKKQKIYQLSKAEHKKPLIEKAISHFYSEVADSDVYKKVKLDKVWYVKTTESNSKPGELPYIPHFDRRRYIKLMVYLNDVTSNDGPFTTATHNVNLYEAQRQSLPNNYKMLGLNSKLHKHDYTEITFYAGSGVIFDTNCAHFAKPVLEGGMRIALRFDFLNYTWNQSLDPFHIRLRRTFFS